MLHTQEMKELQCKFLCLLSRSLWVYRRAKKCMFQRKRQGMIVWNQGPRGTLQWFSNVSVPGLPFSCLPVDRVFSITNIIESWSFGLDF